VHLEIAGLNTTVLRAYCRERGLAVPLPGDRRLEPKGGGLVRCWV